MPFCLLNVWAFCVSHFVLKFQEKKTICLERQGKSDEDTYQKLNNTVIQCCGPQTDLLSTSPLAGAGSSCAEPPSHHGHTAAPAGGARP